MAECGCGRSPTGKCVGWHGLSEEQYQEKKAAYEAKQAAKSAQSKNHGSHLRPMFRLLNCVLRQKLFQV